MTIRTRFLFSIASILVLSACERDAMSEVGFSLPEGTPAAGAEAFLSMQCHQCHTIAGEELPPIPSAEPPYVELGGEVSRVKTYGQLVTAIINPSHKLADGYAKDLLSTEGISNMPIYNDYMTVQELTDLVRYLQPYYEVEAPSYNYRMYP